MSSGCFVEMSGMPEDDLNLMYRDPGPSYRGWWRGAGKPRQGKPRSQTEVLHIVGRLGSGA